MLSVWHQSGVEHEDCVNCVAGEYCDHSKKQKNPRKSLCKWSWYSWRYCCGWAWHWAGCVGQENWLIDLTVDKININCYEQLKAMHAFRDKLECVGHESALIVLQTNTFLLTRKKSENTERQQTLSLLDAMIDWAWRRTVMCGAKQSLVCFRGDLFCSWHNTWCYCKLSVASDWDVWDKKIALTVLQVNTLFCKCIMNNCSCDNIRDVVAGRTPGWEALGNKIALRRHLKHTQKQE